MNSGEERKEQNKQAWRANIEQERLDLSASVEAALMDDGVQIQPWQDELEEQHDGQPVTSGTGIIPPRLSLQSRALPAVQPQRAITTTSHQAFSAPIEEEAEQKSAGMLTRLARRFTSSFTAAHPVAKPTPSQPQAPVAASERTFTQDMEAYHPGVGYGELSVPVSYYEAPLVRVIDTISASAPIGDATSPQSKKQRSLKRNGKVRLETTEQPALPKAAFLPRVEDQETGETLLSADVNDALSRDQPASVPARREALSAPLPTSLSGSGVFESEQSDVMVSNTGITSASVVLVILTTNPGPVVVQYISLQPGTGFTVHLTAPVAMRTMFNYVVL